MKKIKTFLCFAIVIMICLGAFSVNAAFNTHKNDVRLICDLAVQYVNSGSDEIFEQYISDGIDELISDGQFSSSKFVYLYNEDPDFIDVDENQLSKIVAVIAEIYVNGGEAELTQDDINKDVTPGYSSSAGNPDYEEDDAEVFMEIINKGKEVLNPVTKAPSEPSGNKKNDAMPPETNEETKDDNEGSGTSLGVVILVSIIVSSLVFAAGIYALRQVEAKKRPGGVLSGKSDEDEVYNLRLAVKSMQTSLQKADGNFKELDKLRIQVDEIDEKLDNITEYLRKNQQG